MFVSSHAGKFAEIAVYRVGMEKNIQFPVQGRKDILGINPAMLKRKLHDNPLKLLSNKDNQQYLIWRKWRN